MTEDIIGGMFFFCWEALGKGGAKAKVTLICPRKGRKTHGRAGISWTDLEGRCAKETLLHTLEWTWKNDGNSKGGGKIQMRTKNRNNLQMVCEIVLDKGKVRNGKGSWNAKISGMMVENGNAMCSKQERRQLEGEG